MIPLRSDKRRDKDMRRLWILGVVLLALVQVVPAGAQVGPNDAAVQKAIAYTQTQ